MRLTRSDARWNLLLAFAALLLPQSGFASDFGISDVSLHKGGTLYGQLVDEQGGPQTKSEVVLRHDQRVVAVAKTDADGRFAVAGLRGGVYQIETAQGIQVYRLWAPTTAPPAARSSILLVRAHEVVRAQIDVSQYGPAIRGGVVGALLGAGTYWALDYNAEGS